MSQVFKEAIAEVATLPEPIQDKIGRELRAYVEKLRRLRDELEQGVRSLDAGAGKPLDLEATIKRARGAHGPS